MDCHDKELSLLFTDDQQMAALNRQYRGREGSTDVLSFSMMETPEGESAEGLFEPVMLGDVVISVDTARRDAKELHESFEERVDRLLIHGILHLLGFDHETSGVDGERMMEEEARLLALIRNPEMPTDSR